MPRYSQMCKLSIFHREGRERREGPGSVGRAALPGPGLASVSGVMIILG